MAVKQHQLVSLFKKFIQDTLTGKRVKPDGKKIKAQTVKNYTYVLNLLIAYETATSNKIIIETNTGKNIKLLTKERNYWKKFYKNFTQFLYTKKCHDNYAGAVIKVLRTFFIYLKKDRLLAINDFYKHFYVTREEMEIITLMPEQLNFLINNKEFDEQLSAPLKATKQLFVFGCTVALRASDLFSIRFTDIHYVNGAAYLAVKSQKTDTPTKVKLPVYCVDIVEGLQAKARKRKTVFVPISLARFNNNSKQIAEKANWVQPVTKHRSMRGKNVEQLKADKTEFRFCDMVSSHIMRRTAITTMLMLGMPEHIVKKISGHAANSKAFYRYVNFVQSYLDNETDKVYNKLGSIAG